MRTTLRRIDPVNEWAVEAAATHPVFSELFEEIVGAPREGDPAVVIPSLDGPARRQLPRRALLAGAAAVAVLIGALAGTGVIGGGGGLSGPFTTPWHQAHALDVGRSAHGAGTWRLVDDVLTGTWQQNDYGPPPGYLSCATPDRCYVMAGKYPSAMAGAPLLSESLYVTTDQGADWTVLPMPSGFDPSTALACAGATWCAAGGTYQGQAVLLTTADGGHTFRVTPLPGGVGTLRALTCPANGDCDGLVASSTGSVTGALDATFLAVTGSGATFSDRPILSGDSMVALACTSPQQCTVVGETDTTENTVIPIGVAAVTSDAGTTWTAGSVPKGFGIQGMLSKLACTDATHCVVTGRVAIENATQCPVTTPGMATATAGPTLASITMAPAVRTISQTESQIAATWAHKTPGSGSAGGCSTGAVTEVSVVATTSDGGRSWTPEALPGDVPNPQFNGLACPSATECWVSGSESIPQKVGNTLDEGSPVLLGTTNAGAIWSKVTFSVAATAPNPTGQSFVTIGAISCPSANVCVAKGSGAQGADVSPIYSLVIPAG
ncbi:MAG: hypothetical protein ACRDYB_03520 [Acidimicrobiales bacterium]